MTFLTRRGFAVLAACACLPTAAAAQDPAPSGKYVCPPCGCSNDGKVFDKPGVCPDPSCGMTLIAAPTEPRPQGPAAAPSLP
jgi:hypothetical protein